MTLTLVPPRHRPELAAAVAVHAAAAAVHASSCCSFGIGGAVLRAGSGLSTAPALASAASALAQSPKVALRSSPPSMESMLELFCTFGLAHGTGLASLGSATCGVAPCCATMKGRGPGRTTRVCVMT